MGKSTLEELGTYEKGLIALVDIDYSLDGLDLGALVLDDLYDLEATLLDSESTLAATIASLEAQESSLLSQQSAIAAAIAGLEADETALLGSISRAEGELAALISDEASKIGEIEVKLSSNLGELEDVRSFLQPLQEIGQHRARPWPLAQPPHAGLVDVDNTYGQRLVFPRMPAQITVEHQIAQGGKQLRLLQLGADRGKQRDQGQPIGQQTFPTPARHGSFLCGHLL